MPENLAWGTAGKGLRGWRRILGKSWPFKKPDY
jgi:hypothetical protein